ncbi:hypothetical protein [Epilithonimonas xixisoli]|uniref:Uncharacterized protein n=1 Tax=Epilithonimonas xixisoli TaxID=1476462 RepID=A0A4R8I864_9FLAO|nr:hypothetical protein [Epilithonimonas xixisoli]TDX86212.1 hypothetical protein B0I22_0322 [Epilithonimonas xixisoli]
MTASELLDEIVKTITSLGPSPLVSETIKAYKKAEMLIKDEMDGKFNDGYEHRKKCEINAKLNQQQKLN